MAFHPYLFFGGTCADAFTRYQEVFGGELQLLRMGDVPGEAEVPPKQAGLVLHASLTFGEGDLLMGSDDPVNDPFPTPQGMMCCYEAPDADEAQRVFAALAEGGSVNAPIGPTFFSPMFGMCVDRFGTPWMVDTATDS